ncbi:MAG: MBL fold metallo-hydrolase [Lachnospiraceae bacterium]|nr:MBL fold metallo-hydrolase [Lachnospiraceae bacterium]
MSYGVRIKWNTIASFEIQYKDTAILTDPCITVNENTDLTWEDVEKCDIITITHVHWDHITDLPVLTKKFNPKVLLGELSAMPLTQWMDYNPSNVYPMEPNLELDFGEVKVKALFGKHVDQNRTIGELDERIGKNPLCQADPFMKSFQTLGSLEYRNFLFTFDNGTKVLMWGNNPRIEQQKILSAIKPDIAILQFTKHEPDEMAEFAKSIGAKVMIPHHMDLKHTEEEYMPRLLRLAEAFERKVPDGKFIVPKHGEWVEL